MVRVFNQKKKRLQNTQQIEVNPFLESIFGLKKLLQRETPEGFGHSSK